jgi:hypothetical protein
MNHTYALRVGTIMAGILGTMAGSQRTLAQAVPDPTRPAVPAAGGNWWDAPVNQPQRNDPGRSILRRDNTVMDYPGPQMSDWVMASALSARARAVELRAQSDLDDTIRSVQRRFEHSDDYLKAVAEEKQAYADYTVARQKAIHYIAGDPKYVALSMLRDELADKIAARRNAKDINGNEIAVMATLKMQYAADARTIEVNAMNSDDNVKAAREKMEHASRRLVDMKSRFEDATHDNPEVLIARRALADARIAVVETSALACSAGIASTYAINYSYYLHRNDVSGPYGPYGPNGAAAGGSYTSPYWR